MRHVKGIAVMPRHGDTRRRRHAGAVVRRLRVTVSLLAASLLVTSGCGGGGNDSAKIVIEYWHQPMISVVPGKEEFTQEPGDYERYLAEEFMRRHENVIVRTQCLNWEDLPTKVPIAVTAGSPPDVLQDYLGRTSGYWYQGVLEPLEEVIADEREDFDSRMLEKHTLDGHLHALPLYGWMQLMAINRAVWENAGKTHLLPSAEAPVWDFEQFQRALEAVAVPGELYPLGLQVASEQGDYSILQFFWGMGADVYEDQQYDHVALNSPAGVKALNWLVNAHGRGLIQSHVTTIGASELNDMFWRGEIALLPSGLNLIRMLERARAEGRVSAEIDLIFTLPPVAKGLQPRLAMGTSGLCVFRQSDPEKKQMVEQFVRFLARDEVIRDYCLAAYQVPLRKSVGDIFAGQPKLARLQEHVAGCKIADMGLTSRHFYEVRKLLPPQLQAAFLKRKSPAQALEDFEREAAAVLKR